MQTGTRKSQSATQQPATPAQGKNGLAFAPPAQFRTEPGETGIELTTAVPAPFKNKLSGSGNGEPLQRRNSKGAFTVQRYQGNDMAGAIDATTYAERAGQFNLGLNGFSQSNRGWISVTTNAGAVHRIERESGGAGHTEEQLLAAVQAQFGNIFMNDPNDNTLTRITEIYTERRPCGAAGEQVANDRAARQPGSCHNLLGGIHNNIRVSYSVANDAAAHAALMANERTAYVNEVVADTKRITGGHLRTRANGDLQNLATAIRARNNVVNGNYGRDYMDESQRLGYAHLALIQAHAQLSNALAAMGDHMPAQLALGPMLQDLNAQCTGAHNAGSAAIFVNLAARREAWLTAIDSFGKLYFGLEDAPADNKKDNKKDEGPKKPPPSAGGGSGGTGTSSSASSAAAAPASAMVPVK